MFGPFTEVTTRDSGIPIQPMRASANYEINFFCGGVRLKLNFTDARQLI